MASRSRLPTPAECTEGARLAADSARRRLGVSKTVDRSGDHGLALFLVVAALEEAVRSIALSMAVATSQDGRLHPKMRGVIGDVLAGHPQRYAIASLSRMTSPLARGATAGERGAAGLGLMVMGIALALMTQEQREAWMTDALVELLAQRETDGWFSTALDERAAGLYVDWRRGRWHGPTEVDDVRVSVARRHVAPIVRSATLLARDPSNSAGLGLVVPRRLSSRA